MYSIVDRMRCMMTSLLSSALLHLLLSFAKKNARPEALLRMAARWRKIESDACMGYLSAIHGPRASGTTRVLAWRADRTVPFALLSYTSL